MSLERNGSERWIGTRNTCAQDRDEEERQREEAERALAGPVQVDVVRAALGVVVLAPAVTPTTRRLLVEPTEESA